MRVVSVKTLGLSHITREHLQKYAYIVWTLLSVESKCPKMIKQLIVHINKI